METLDPVLIKALKLLESSSKASTDELKAMLDDAMAQRRAQLKLPDYKVSMSWQVIGIWLVDWNESSQWLVMSCNVTFNYSLRCQERKELLGNQGKPDKSSLHGKAAKKVKREDDSETTDIEEND